MNHKFTLTTAQVFITGLGFGLIAGVFAGAAAFEHGWAKGGSGYHQTAKDFAGAAAFEHGWAKGGSGYHQTAKDDVSSAALVAAPKGDLAYTLLADYSTPDPLSVPVRAFVENGKTVIEFDRPIDVQKAPGLYIMGMGEEKQLHYSIEGRRYKVDGLLTEWAYLIGPSVRPTMKSRFLVQPEYEPWRPVQAPVAASPSAN